MPPKTSGKATKKAGKGTEEHHQERQEAEVQEEGIFCYLHLKGLFEDHQNNSESFTDLNIVKYVILCKILRGLYILYSFGWKDCNVFWLNILQSNIQ